MPHVHHIDIAIISTEMEVAGAQTVYVLQVRAPAPGRILAGRVHAGPAHMRNCAASGNDQA